MRIAGLAHVGILVPDVRPAAELFGRMGCAVAGPERDDDLGLWLLWVDVGGATLEFVAPARDDSRAAAALARGEGGVHHVALEVADVEAAVAELAAGGTPVRDAEPRRGAHGSRVSFLDPAAAGGALIELVEP
jgi:methylmalonyl-CoA/ethylmalonyl-CoA epimerase